MNEKLSETKKNEQALIEKAKVIPTRKFVTKESVQASEQLGKLTEKYYNRLMEVDERDEDGDKTIQDLLAAMDKQIDKIVELTEEKPQARETTLSEEGSGFTE